MTETLQSKPGALVLYKVKKESIWWPAVLFPSHVDAQPFTNNEVFRSDHEEDISSQFFNELNPESPSKPLVCVISHPNRPANEKWWYQVDNDVEEIKIFTPTKMSEYRKDTPDGMWGTFCQVLSNIATKKVQARECRMAEYSMPSGAAVPNEKVGTARGPTEDELVLQNSPKATTLAPVSSGNPDAKAANVAPVPNGISSAKATTLAPVPNGNPDAKATTLAPVPNGISDPKEPTLAFVPNACPNPKATTLAPVLNEPSPENTNNQTKEYLDTPINAVELPDNDISYHRTSLDETPRRKNATKKTVTASHRRVSDVSSTSEQEEMAHKSKDCKSVEVKENSQPEDQKAKKKSAPAMNISAIYQGSQSVPIFLLVKIGFQLVGETLLSFKFTRKISFTFSFIGLPVFLARYGIPNAHKLKDEELKKIHSWVRFANIPKATPFQLRRSENLSSAEVQDILLAFGFEICSGTIFVPNCPNHNREGGIHYFREDCLQSDFRSFLGWALDYASLCETQDDFSSSDDDDGNVSARKQIDCLRFVSELKMNTPEHDLYTQLRLWAATQDEPLPAFSARILDVDFMEAVSDTTIGAPFANLIQAGGRPIETLSDEDDDETPPPSLLAKAFMQSIGLTPSKETERPKTRRGGMNTVQATKRQKVVTDGNESEGSSEKKRGESHNPSQPVPDVAEATNKSTVADVMDRSPDDEIEGCESSGVAGKDDSSKHQARLIEEIILKAKILPLKNGVYRAMKKNGAPYRSGDSVKEVAEICAKHLGERWNDTLLVYNEKEIANRRKTADVEGH